MQVKKLDLQWVTDTIGSTYKQWKCGDIVTLEAQTGTGKTHFIKETLLNSIDWHEKILYVCNRTNLKRQFKKDLLNKFSIKIPETLSELDKITRIKNVIITSYHAIQYGEINNIYNAEGQFYFSDYRYVVFDECHYLLNDAGFTNKCDLSFNKIIKNQDTSTIKIFISATMQRLKKPIYKLVTEETTIHEYSTNRDYSYVNAKYFNKINDITKSIKNDNTDKKWLVFVSGIKQG